MTTGPDITRCGADVAVDASVGTDRHGATPGRENANERLAEHGDRAALIPSVERALFGTEDGGMVADDAVLPVGELRRLLRDEWAGADPEPEVRWQRPVVADADWPQRLSDVSDGFRETLILADPHRYMAQVRSEAREWAEKLVDEELDRRMRERFPKPAPKAESSFWRQVLRHLAGDRS